MSNLRDRLDSIVWDTRPSDLDLNRIVTTVETSPEWHPPCYHNLNLSGGSHVQCARHSGHSGDHQAAFAWSESQVSDAR